MNHSGLVGTAEAFGQAEVATWWDDVLREDPKSVPDWPLLLLPRERVLVRSLPSPTLLQMQQFASFVSNAHETSAVSSPWGAPLRTEIDLAIIDRCRVL